MVGVSCYSQEAHLAHTWFIARKGSINVGYGGVASLTQVPGGEVKQTRQEVMLNLVTPGYLPAPLPGTLPQSTSFSSCPHPHKYTAISKRQEVSWRGGGQLTSTPTFPEHGEETAHSRTCSHELRQADRSCPGVGLPVACGGL